MSAIDLEFTKFCMVSSKGYGLDNLSAKLSSILYLEPIEISIEELAKRTGYSLASISNKMKILESFGMVRRVKNPGSKKLYYYMEKDLVKLTRMHFEKIYTSEIIPAKKMLPEIIEKFKNKNLKKADEEKLNIIIKYHKQITSMETKFDDFLKEIEKIK